MPKKAAVNKRRSAHSTQNGRLTIGCLAPAIAPFWGTQTWLGMKDAAQAHDVNIVTFLGGFVHHPNDAEIGPMFSSQANYIYELASAFPLDGVVLWGGVLGLHGLREQEAVDFIDLFRPLPIVNLESPLHDLPSVLIDAIQNMRTVTEHMLDQHDFKRIAFYAGERPDQFPDRVRGYREAMEARGLYDPDLIFRGKIPELVDWFRSQKKAGLQAVVGPEDLSIIQFTNILQQAGYRIPEDVAVAGLNDDPEGRVLVSPLTTIRMPLYEMGYQGVEQLVKRVRGEDCSDQVKIVSPLIIRQSCGCSSQRVDQGKVLEVVGSAGKTGLRKRRRETVAAMCTHLPDQEDAALAEALFDGFLDDLEKGQENAFLAALKTIIYQERMNHAPVDIWQDVISTLRQQTFAFLVDRAQTLHAENLWQQARLLLGEHQHSLDISDAIQLQHVNETISDLGHELSRTFQLTTIMDVLAQRLPAIGVPGASICLYEDPKPYVYPQRVSEWSRLFLSFDSARRLNVGEDGQRFETHQVLPTACWPQDRRCDRVVEPLFVKEQQLGYVVYETGPRDGQIYYNLRSEIGSAIRSALQTDQVQRRATQLDAASKVSSAASSIIEPDELIRQAVTLVQERFNLYYAGLFLVDETGQWAELRAGTGEAGQQMLAKNHRLPIQDSSMVGWCIRNRKPRIALDVGKEAVRFDNPFLPKTRSELALPLISQDQAIGALTIQSTREAAFSEGDILVLQTMADQLANGIEKARLYNQIQQRAVELSKARDEAENAKLKAETAREEAEAARREAEVEKEKAEIANRSLAAQMWQTNGQALINDRMRGEQDVSVLAANVVQQLCRYLDASSGALYVLREDLLKLAGTFAYKQTNQVASYRMGEGLVGQAALEKQRFAVRVPDDLVIRGPSSVGELSPKFFMVAPFVYEDQTIGVVEMGLLEEISSAQLEFLEAALQSVAIAFVTAQARERVNELFSQTRRQAEELQAQEEELRATNEELEAQTESLRASETKLKSNQAALENANVELEEKAAALQESTAVLREKQEVLDQQNRELEEKAADLALASKYKSEFLANMSHELRTPLNSLLILAGMLAKNDQGNLTPDQIESAQIIVSGGTDLLNLINEILDLAKVEAGRMEFHYADMAFEKLVANLRDQFEPVAVSKGLEFVTSLGEDVPARVETDQQRVEQIIKNLLSNAFKFTKQGSVTLKIHRPDAEIKLSASGLDPAQAIAISVMDTGIGITPEQQKIVFEAFQQADGSTSRQYGGTGLGLTISRELAAKLGGQIMLESEYGKGSNFTLYLPTQKPAVLPGALEQPLQRAARAVRTERPRPGVQTVKQESADIPKLFDDDRNAIQPADRILLVIEDDAKFARIVFDYAHQKHFKCLAAGDGESGLKLAKLFKVDAIILDLNLPVMSGWEVLDALKEDPATRHIPVHIMSVSEENLEAYQRGAMDFLTKPVNQQQVDETFRKIEEFIAKKIKSLLLVEDDGVLRTSVRKLLEGSDVAISEAGDGKTALEKLAAQSFDCMILDLTLPDMSGFELLNCLHTDETLHKCPVIVYTGKELTEDENHELLKYAESVIVKGVKSPERLIDETALFLHRVIADLPEEKQRTIKKLHDPEAVLLNKQILIIDDDARNAFALSKLLTGKGLVVHIASSGQKALELLDKKAVDLILTDIMMPDMDGYEVIRRIRAIEGLRKLPILALTAKAMLGDRDKCLAAGANDYLSKPVDAERLFSMLRVWLNKN